MSQHGRRTSGMHRISHFQTQSVARASVHFLQTRVTVKITRRIRPFFDPEESRRANYFCVEKFPARRIRPFSSQPPVQDQKDMALKNARMAMLLQDQSVTSLQPSATLAGTF